MIFNEAGKAVSKFNWEISKDWTEAKNISATINGKKYDNLKASCNYPDANFDIKLFEKFINSANKLMTDKAIKNIYENYKDDYNQTHNDKDMINQPILNYKDFKKCLIVELFTYSFYKGESCYFITGNYPNNIGADHEHGWAIQYSYNGKEFQYECVGPADIAF